MQKKFFPITLIVIIMVALLASISSADDPVQLTQDGAEENAGNSANLAPVLGKNRATAIKDQYIVVFKDTASNANVNAAKANVSRMQGVAIGHSYETVLNGFSATLSGPAVEALRNNPNVAYIEADQRVTIVETPASWGLDRVDQRDMPLDDSYTRDADGSGVHVYIIDTGINPNHNEFTGRVSNGWNTVGTRIKGQIVPNDDPSDCHGHGTHVAGTTAGSTYGFASGATIHAVKVLDCDGSGSGSGVIAGIEWVTDNHIAPAVANMSLGGGYSAAENAAVAASIDSGVVYAIAAGNEDSDACGSSPASEPSALTVGATGDYSAGQPSDTRASFSNWGSCVDLFAPGVAIVSADYSTTSGSVSMNGTSMASPHVAGVAALYYGENPNKTAAQVTADVIAMASNGRVSDLQGSPNKLLYWGTEPDSGDPGPSPTPTPDPGSGGDCSGYNNSVGGTLSNGGSEYWSYGGAVTSGMHSGLLTGPAGADFDLYLQYRKGGTWRTAASSTSTSSNESIDYNAPANEYRWKVTSYSGSGSYSLCVNP